MQDARQIVDAAISRWPGRNFLVNSEFGPLILLAPRFAEEIRSDSRLSFARFMAHHTMSNYPGFEVFSEGAQDSTILKEVIGQHMNKGIGKLFRIHKGKLVLNHN